jgi:hypothetical protein
MWGARGPFLPTAAMVVAVMMLVVFVLRLLKNAIKTIKLVVRKQKFLFITIYCKTYYNSRSVIVAWLEPEPLWSNRTPAYWVSPKN